MRWPLSSKEKQRMGTMAPGGICSGNKVVDPSVAVQVGTVDYRARFQSMFDEVAKGMSTGCFEAVVREDFRGEVYRYASNGLALSYTLSYVHFLHRSMTVSVSPSDLSPELRSLLQELADSPNRMTDGEMKDGSDWPKVAEYSPDFGDVAHSGSGDRDLQFQVACAFLENNALPEIRRRIAEKDFSENEYASKRNRLVQELGKRYGQS